MNGCDFEHLDGPDTVICSQYLDWLTLTVASDINNGPTGVWADFNLIHYKWRWMTVSNINTFCQQLIGDEPVPEDYGS